ncbi:glycosyl transferase [Leptospira yasudae]|uniref:glycosyl transferase n=1 Tax=Leptospira yasudae TaxID=2202201 RepID=UPI000E59A401|nr:glycosyl transferase [Leptospira yasudae]RHX91218.1 glycosyl transferase [Leptospira yasudae]
MKYLCTLFDSNYLPLGLSLYDSIKRHFGNFHLWILAMDDKSYSFLKELSLTNVTVLALSDVEAEDVLTAKNNRTWQEYCWTLSPVLPSFILNRNSDIDHITYLDSDIYFYSDPKPIYDEIGENSVMIIPHRFPDRLKHLETNGIYNVQMVYFKRDEIGMKCLNRWREQCIEWCYSRLETNRFGDQKYLDVWPQTYERVCVLKNEQSGVALWNIERYDVKLRNEAILIDGLPLIFYHFHMFKFYSGSIYSTGVTAYNLNFINMESIYMTYVDQVVDVVIRYKLKLKKLNVFEIFALIDRRNFYATSYFTKLFWETFLFGFVRVKRFVACIYTLLRKVYLNA